jgi:nicotinate (nicotinamide) nucleotide adenylyltransferase
MKIGLFGGSFDPIHCGHVEPVKEARRLLGLERVIYLPTAIPPHKPGRVLAPPLARYAMVEMAILSEEGLYASPYELTLDRPAYTAETLEHFQRELPAAELHLLIGGDSFFELPRWVRWRDIAAAARLVVLARPGWDLAGLAAASESGESAVSAGSVESTGTSRSAERFGIAGTAERPGTAETAGPGQAGAAGDRWQEPQGQERRQLSELLASGRVRVLEQRPYEVSSTRLRELLARGERPPAGWMPDLVVDFVHKYRLYR